MKFIYKYSLPLLWSSVIIVLCLLPQNDLPKSRFFDIPYFDKYVHASLYFVLYFLLLRSLKKFNIRIYFIAILLCIGYGISIEIFQHFFTSDRHFEVYDILANSSGTIISSIVSPSLLKFILSKY